MNGNCLDIGTIQAFLDGEAGPNEAIKISDHIGACNACAAMLAAAEDENSLVFSVLDRELNSLVPTQRLWNRINETIAVEKSRVSFWQRLAGLLTANIASPTFAAAAGILLVVAISAVVVTLESSKNNVGLVAVDSAKQDVRPPFVSNSTSVAENNDEKGTSAPIRSEKAAVESKLPEAQLRRMVANAAYIERGPKKTLVVPASISPQYLPGEESYIRTINQLEQNVTVQSASLKASSQFAYERDLAVVNDSIVKMRHVVKKNPKNQSARQVLYSAYQDKIDLLKSSMQSGELMASLQ